MTKIKVKFTKRVGLVWAKQVINIALVCEAILSLPLKVCLQKQYANHTTPCLKWSQTQILFFCKPQVI